MSLYFLEGFGAYTAGSSHAFGAGAEMLLQFSSWNSTPTLTSKASGSQGNRKYLSSSGTDPDMHLKLNGLDSTTIVIGFRIYHEGMSGNAGHIIRCEDAGSNMGSILITANGTPMWSIQNQQGTGTAYPTATRRCPAYNWTYVEVKVYLHSSAGTCDFWINGEAAGSYTGIQTRYLGTSCDGMRLGNDDAYSQWESDMRITDIYVDDSTQHGPMDIWYQAADTAGSAANFTPSAGSNYQNVDDIGSDGDSTYNSSTATTTLDQIAHSNTLAVAPLCLNPMVMARYVPTGSASIKVGLLSSTTHDQASAVGLGETYDGVQGKYYVNDPNTASPWASAAAADAAETTYEHA